MLFLGTLFVFVYGWDMWLMLLPFFAELNISFVFLHLKTLSHFHLSGKLSRCVLRCVNNCFKIKWTNVKRPEISLTKKVFETIILLICCNYIWRVYLPTTNLALWNFTIKNICHLLGTTAIYHIKYDLPPAQ